MNTLISTVNSWGAAFTEFAWPMLVQSTLLIAGLLALIRLCQRMRAVFRYALLLLILVKLLLPPSLSLPTGLGYWAALDQAPAAQTIDSIRPASGALIMPPGGSSPRLSTSAVLLLAWITGMGVLGVLALRRGVHLSRWTSQSERAPAGLQRLFESCQAQIGIHRSLRLEVSTVCASPCVCGLLEPVILVPRVLTERLSPTQLRSVLLHELAHVKRGDLWVNHVQVLLLIFYWYNPLLWLANAVIRRVREQAVDETVMAILGRDAEDYPETLVAVAALASAQTGSGLRWIGIMESKTALKTRLARLIEGPIPTRATLSWAHRVMWLALGGVLLPMAHPEPRQPSAPLPRTTEGSIKATREIPKPGASEPLRTLRDPGLRFEEGRQTRGEPWIIATLDTPASNNVAKLVIHRTGPSHTADAFIQGKIQTTVGKPFARERIDADVRALYATGLFQNIRVTQERSPTGVSVSFFVQERLRLSAIQFTGNRNVRERELRGKLVSRPGDPLDERKLFADAERLQESYQQAGYPDAQVKYTIQPPTKTGAASVTFQIVESRPGQR